jgi:hypothetical protein
VADLARVRPGLLQRAEEAAGRHPRALHVAVEHDTRLAVLYPGDTAPRDLRRPARFRRSHGQLDHVPARQLGGKATADARAADAQVEQAHHVLGASGALEAHHLVGAQTPPFARRKASLVHVTGEPRVRYRQPHALALGAGQHRGPQGAGLLAALERDLQQHRRARRHGDLRVAIEEEGAAVDHVQVPAQLLDVVEPVPEQDRFLRFHPVPPDEVR